MGRMTHPTRYFFQRKKQPGYFNDPDWAVYGFFTFLKKNKW